MGENDQFGPAFGALTEKQRQFVLAYLNTCTETAQGNATAAARAAGYVDNGTAMVRISGHRLIHDPKILAAIRELVERGTQAFLPTAMAILRAEAINPQSKDRLKAATTLAAIAGVSPVMRSETHSVVEHTVNTEELIAKAQRLSALLGIDPRKLIGRRADIIDVTPPQPGDEDYEWTAS